MAWESSKLTSYILTARRCRSLLRIFPSCLARLILENDEGVEEFIHHFVPPIGYARAPTFCGHLGLGGHLTICVSSVVKLSRSGPKTSLLPLRVKQCASSFFISLILILHADDALFLNNIFVEFVYCGHPSPPDFAWWPLGVSFLWCSRLFVLF